MAPGTGTQVPPTFWYGRLKVTRRDCAGEIEVSFLPPTQAVDGTQLADEATGGPRNCVRTEAQMLASLGRSQFSPSMQFGWHS